MTTKTNLDGDWRVRYRERKGCRYSFYVIVVGGLIVEIERGGPGGQRQQTRMLAEWFRRPFTAMCGHLIGLYPRTFERERLSKRIIKPQCPPAPGGQDIRPGDPTLEEIAERGAKIRRGWATKNRNDFEPPSYERRVVSTAGLRAMGKPVEPLELMAEEPWMPRAKLENE
ncbi:hypothetical protein LCGC14_1042520 [marine sediment metagenome]|uniref:Uncharacterized protein n=1 Tax=marine sediment metagenome TaxID=412755 RepID=A0A0F9MVS3_9ZZZZ